MKNLNFRILMALSAVSLSALTSQADTFKVNNIFYSPLTATTAAVVEDPEDELAYQGSVTIPAQVTYNGTTYDVTEIGKNCFRNDAELSSVTLPTSIVKIGNMAFATCTSLQSVNLQDTKITALPYAIFSGCTSLKTITIPATVTTIDGNPIVNNKSMTAINVAEGNSVYKSIDGVLFSINGKWLLAYPGGKGVNYTVPEGTEVISNDAFNTCRTLEKVTLPSPLRTIRNNGFLYCTSLRQINIPESLDSIWPSVFSSCRELKLTFDLSKVSFIGGGAFQNSGVTSVILNGALRGISDDTFNNASNLTSVTIPEGPVMIGSMAFNRTALTKIVVPNSVTRIDGNAFADCKQLKEIEIGSGVKNIGLKAFYNCEPTSFTSHNPVPPKVSVNTNFPMFSTSVFSSCHLYVPQAAIDTYKAADTWKLFSQIDKINNGISSVDGESEVIISARQGVLNVKGAEMVTVYTLSGNKVYQGQGENIKLIPGNVYIVNADGKTTKIAL